MIKNTEENRDQYSNNRCDASSWKTCKFNVCSGIHRKREVVYTNTITIGAHEVKFREFYLSAPAGLFEVKIKVSNGTFNWTPHSAVMFEDTLGWFPRRIT